jgi:hypothetical protein
MNKKESLDFLNACIEKLQEVNEEDIQRMQKVYEDNRNKYRDLYIDDFEEYKRDIVDVDFDVMSCDISYYKNDLINDYCMNSINGFAA